MHSFKADERGDGPEPAKDGGEGTGEADIALQLMTSLGHSCNPTALTSCVVCSQRYKCVHISGVFPAIAWSD